MFYSDFSMGRWIFGIIFGLFLKESGSFPVKYSNYVSLLFRNMLDSWRKKISFQSCTTYF